MSLRDRLGGMFGGGGPANGQGGSDLPVLRAMTPADLDTVYKIIYAFDEDDADEARSDFQRGEGRYFVFATRDEIVGCAGFSLDEETLGAAWLSWTYVAEAHQRNGHGTAMMIALRGFLEAAQARRLFIDTSDYKEDGVDIYAPARSFYEDHLQARLEIVIEDFYQPGEAKYIYSLPVLEDDIAPPGDYSDYDAAHLHLEFRDIAPAAESETGYVVAWAESDEPASDPVADLSRWVERARAKGGHLLSINLPSGLAKAHTHVLSGAGFTYLGQVQDYYAPGVHDDYWAAKLTQT